MKSILKFQIAIGLLSVAAYGQADVPVNFTKRGFVQNIDYEQKLILVNFVPDPDDKNAVYQIESEALELADPQIVNTDIDNPTIKDLKSSDEILVEGEHFRKTDRRLVKKITFVNPKVKSIKGRIDLIKDNFVYVNGNKIKLKEGKEIIGKEGFEGKTFKSVTEISLGDMADISGKYNKSGYYLADSFKITPEDQTEYDKAALEMEKEDYDKLYPLWTNAAKRKTLLGTTTIPGLGKINADAALQEYVNTVGLKLVPAHIKEKINFIFIVVDNPDLLAFVRPNGLAYICTGLLKNLENEAQLATVLGHEIAHAMYEHQAEESAKGAKNKSTKESIAKAGSSVLKAFNMKNRAQSTKDGKGKADEEKLEKKSESNATLTIGAETLSGSYIDKRSSDFTVDQEYLADRVGLCLMVMAGYDPREAPIVWKNIFDRYGIRTKPEEGANFTEVVSENAGRKGVNIFVAWKTADYKAKSTKTHPDEMRRFVELNRLIALYWNNEELLAQTNNGETKYIDMRKRIKLVRS